MAYRKCPAGGLTLNLNDERDDDPWERGEGRPVIGHTPAGEPLREGDSVCDNCGNIAHTEAELATCINSMLAPVEMEDDDDES